MKKALLVLTICFAMAPAHAAITFNCAANGPNPNGGNVTQNICGGTLDGDYTIIGVVANTPQTSNAAPYQTPATWTSLGWTGGFQIFGRFWHTGDPTSVTLVPQNGTSSWETSAELSYTGVNVSTPVDGTNASTFWADSTLGGTAVIGKYARAPAMFPSWTTDFHLSFFFVNTSGGGSYSTPGGWTARITNGPGPNIYIFEKALASAAKSGPIDSTCCSGNQQPKSGAASLLLKPASGGASATRVVQPTIAAVTIGNASTTGSPLGFITYTGLGPSLYPAAGDLLLICPTNGSSNITASGWSVAFNETNLVCFTSLYNGSTPTSITLNGTSGGNPNFIYAIRNWQYPITGISPSVDNYGLAAHVASGTSIATPSVGLRGVNDLGIGMFVASSTTTWTLDASLDPDEGCCTSTPPNESGSIQAPTNPSGTYTSTSSGTLALDAGSIFFVIGAGGNQRGRGSVF